jgi:two-component system phosphate regulon sensor histidine kinase PhoR
MKNEPDRTGNNFQRLYWKWWLRSLIPLLTLFVIAWLVPGLSGKESGFRPGPELLLALLVSLAVSIPVAFFYSRKIAVPLREIEENARQFGEGDFSRRVLAPAEDEMEKAAAAFNQMADKLSVKLRETSGEQTQLSAVLNGMTEGIMIVDAGGVVRLTNPSLNKMFSLQVSYPRPTYYYELIRHHELNEFIRSVLTEKRNLSIEIAFTHPRESYFQVQASVTPQNRDKGLFFAALVFHEITELRRLERIRKDFVANVSHELRTPLTSIKGYLEALAESESSLSAEGLKFLSILQKQSERMENIVSDILQLAQIESGKEKLQKKSLSVMPVLEKTVAAVSPLANKKGQSIEILSPEPVEIRADSGMLVRIIVNLLDNAIKYTPDGGKIILGCRKGPGFVEIYVKDNGIGIPPADQPRIFERFYRVDRARSREMGGTGLGLSIVKHLMEAHGGTIRVESYPNQGSTFTARFPDT